MSSASEGVLLADSRVEESELSTRENAVARADLAFAASLRDVSAAGRGTMQRASSMVKPVLIGACVLAIAGFGLGFVRRSPKRNAGVSNRVEPNGSWSGLARAVAVAFAAAAGRRLIEHWLEAQVAGIRVPSTEKETAMATKMNGTVSHLEGTCT